MARKTSAESKTTRSNAQVEVTAKTKAGSVSAKPKVTVLVSPSLHPVGGFLDFLRGQGVVGLAIGFVIATQVQSVVKQLLQSFIDPLLGLVLGGSGTLSTKVLTVHYHNKSTQFAWGSFVYILLDFLMVILVVYLIIHWFRLDKLDKKKDK